MLPLKPPQLSDSCLVTWYFQHLAVALPRPSRTADDPHPLVYAQTRVVFCRKRYGDVTAQERPMKLSVEDFWDWIASLDDDQFGDHWWAGEDLTKGRLWKTYKMRHCHTLQVRHSLPLQQLVSRVRSGLRVQALRDEMLGKVGMAMAEAKRALEGLPADLVPLQTDEAPEFRIAKADSQTGPLQLQFGINGYWFRLVLDEYADGHAVLRQRYQSGTDLPRRGVQRSLAELLAAHLTRSGLQTTVG